jgi:two-component system invasion response regulator UvrY
MNKIKLVICDDHQLFSSALAEMLEKQADLEVLFTASNGNNLLEKLHNRPVQPDIVLLDVNMPELDGFETAKQLKEKYPSIKILALSMNRTDDDVIGMLRNGARGYILKDASAIELKNAINELQAKGFYNNELSAKGALHLIHGAKEIEFNEREKEFLKWVCTELTYKEIADKMNVSPRTVDGYRDSLFEKIGVKTRTGLAVYAIQHKYFKPGT